MTPNPLPDPLASRLALQPAPPPTPPAVPAAVEVLHPASLRTPQQQLPPPSSKGQQARLGSLALSHTPTWHGHL